MGEPQLTAPRRLRREQRPLPIHYDPAAQAIIRRVAPRTMTAPIKLYSLVIATRYVAQHQIPGDLVECGVWRGGSMQAVALTLLECGAADRELHLYDTFAGMPPPGEQDRRLHDAQLARDLLATQDRDSDVWAVATLDDVREGMAEVGYPNQRVHFHEGMVERTLLEQVPEQIALLRLDTDWYESTRVEMEVLYDRLSPGGVLILDDYGHWAGARQAVDEFLARTGEPLLLLPIASGRIAVKPGL
ncbi:MAG: TylF/MycF/NovP-related O-methyltransferase [Nocardioidaceae bacterium]